MPHRLGALLANALTRSALEEVARKELADHTTVDTPFNLLLHESTLDRVISRYSEQVIFNARRELQYWFAYTGGAHLEPGYAPLYYFWKGPNPCPNKSVVAAIGEGVAGYLAQRQYRCVMLARPSHDYPDIVLEAVDDHATYLVEAKATIVGQPGRGLDDNILRFASNTAAANDLDVRPVRGLLVSTSIENESLFNVEFIEIRITP